METTDATFERDVLAADLPVLVDFWAPWCRPCKAISPLLDELVERHAGRVQLAKMNVDENVQTPAGYGVLSLPTVILFANGEPAETIVGARSRSHYEDAVGRVLSQG